MSQSPWWLVAGPLPAVVNDGKSWWNFSGNSFSLTIEKTTGPTVKPLVLIREEISKDKAFIIFDLQQSGNLISGVYDTWQQFAKAHEQ